MSLLHLHTQLLELLDWDEEAVDEATNRTTEIAKELSSDGVSVNVFSLKKRLELEYNTKIVGALIQFFEAAAVFESQLTEDNDIGDSQ